MPTWEKNASTVNLLQNVKTAHRPVTSYFPVEIVSRGFYKYIPAKMLSTRHTKGKEEEIHGPCSKDSFERKLCYLAQQNLNSKVFQQMTYLTSTQRKARRLWPCKTSLIRQMSLVQSPGTRAEVANQALEPIWHPCCLAKSNYTKSAHDELWRLRTL